MPTSVSPEGKLLGRDIAQRRTARDIGMVAKRLEARPSFFSQKPHDRGGGRVGRVFLIAAVLQHPRRRQ